MTIYRLPMIRCAVCNRSVSKVTLEDDLQAQEKVFTVECHGETDVCRLSYSWLQSLTAEQMRTAEAVAFQAKPAI